MIEKIVLESFDYTTAEKLYEFSQINKLLEAGWNIKELKFIGDVAPESFPATATVFVVLQRDTPEPKAEVIGA
jgi:hypothetical protein